MAGDSGGPSQKRSLCQEPRPNLYLAVCEVRIDLRTVTGLRRMPFPEHGFEHAQAAIEFADRMHARQHRADGTPFILHPLEVASLLYYAGADDDLIAAGVMHDLVEKTDVTPTELRERFGLQITSLVLAVSDDDRITDYEERKAALRRQVRSAGEDALNLFAADKVSKLRELHRETDVDSSPSAVPGRVRKLRARRLRHYRRSLALLEERIPESLLVRELRNELNALLGDRALTATG